MTAPRLDEYPAARSDAAVVVVFGGGWYSGSPARVRTICQNMQAAGWPTFAPDYTLSGVAPYPQANTDLTAALTVVRARGYARVGAIGLSAGGNLVGWLASRDLVDVAVMWSPPADLTVPLATWRSPSLRAHVRAFARTPAARHDASPALTGIATVPTLIFNSRHELIPKFQAEQLLAACGGVKQLTLFDGTRHAAAYTAAALPGTLAWIDAHLPA